MSWPDLDKLGWDSQAEGTPRPTHPGKGQLNMTVGPGVGDAVTGQPAPTAAQPVARGGYVPGVSDQPATFDVGGEQVSLNELQQGYLRQRDYTQKTQLLSSQRQQYEAATRLAEALQSDPRGTLVQLAAASGVDLASLQDPQAQSAYGGNSYGQPEGGQAQTLDPADPVQAELMQLREMVQQLQTGYESIEDHQANVWLDQQTAEAAQIFQQSGLELDPDELYQYAAERELTDVNSAAKAMAWDKLTEQLQAASGQPGPLPPEYSQYESQGQPQQDLAASGLQQAGLGSAQRLAAAAQTPRGGMTSAAPLQPQPQPGTVEEAFAQTLRDLGIRDLSQVNMT